VNAKQQSNCGKLVKKEYSLRDAFGPDFPGHKPIVGFEPSMCRFVPKRNPLWHWDRAVLRDLMWWWQSEERDGLYLFGAHGTGKSSAVRQFAASLCIPLYAVGIHEELWFDELVMHTTLAGGNTVPSYAYLPLAMGAEDYPGIFCANEIDRGRPGMLVGLHEVLDGEPLVVQLGGLEPIDPSPYFRIAATGNTAMASDASGLYVSAKRQDVSLADRFSMTKVNYLPEAEELALLERMAPDLPVVLREAMVKVANAIRARFMGESPDKDALPLTMSTRMLLRWVRRTLAFRGAPPEVNPVFYALEGVLLNAAKSSKPGVHTSLSELAMGILGPNPVIT
jgi:cobaltochelatase CobS